jgi:DNA-binding PadR family transcriptional regulator
VAPKRHLRLQLPFPDDATFSVPGEAKRLRLYLSIDTSPKLIYSQSSIYRSSILMPKRKLDPLPSSAFQILLSLADSDLHGYAIMQRVRQQTNGRMRLGPGTLYSSIQALLEEDIIEELEPKADAGPSDRRRVYRLTTTGRRLVRSEAERLVDLLRVARSRKIFREDYV